MAPEKPRELLYSPVRYRVRERPADGDGGSFPVHGAVLRERHHPDLPRSGLPAVPAFDSRRVLLHAVYVCAVGHRDKRAFHTFAVLRRIHCRHRVDTHVRSGLFEPLKRLPTDAEGLVADFRGGDGPAAKEPQRLARFAERPEPHGQRRRDLRGVACHLAVDAERGKRIASRLLPPAVGVSHRRPPEAREDVSRADAVDCLTTATERDARDEFAHVGGEVP